MSHVKIRFGLKLFPRFQAVSLHERNLRNVTDIMRGLIHANILPTHDRAQILDGSLTV